MKWNQRWAWLSHSLSVLPPETFRHRIPGADCLSLISLFLLHTRLFFTFSRFAPIQPSPSCTQTADSSGSCLSHLVAVSALPLWNMTLRDLVVLISVATSLKWLMIMNPTGGEIRLICIYPQHHMHKYQSMNKSLSSRVSGELRFICSVSVMWMPWTCADGWLTAMQTSKEEPAKVTALSLAEAVWERRENTFHL